MRVQSNRQAETTGERAPAPRLHDEEETGRASTPRKDLASAVLVALSAVAIMASASRLEVPARWYTAPGLLPLLTGAALLAMSAALGWQALRGGAARHLLGDLVARLRGIAISDEDRRAALLSGLVVAYVVLVARVGFELRYSTPAFELVISAYELISILIITIVLRLFWRASRLSCFLVSLAGVELLAWAFRYGFNMIMPEAF